MIQSYNASEIRKLFPAVENMTYLDSAFQTPMCTPVKEAIEQFISESYYAAGPKSRWIERLEVTRHKIAQLLSVAPTEIAFTKNTSESMNIAAQALPLKSGDNILMIKGDHPNNAYAFLNLKKKGVDIRFVTMSDVMERHTFEDAIDSRTRAISMSQVTFHAGHKFHVESVGTLCKERGLYFILDAMQGIGVIPINARALGATFLGAGTHKGLLVPQGLGILYWDSSKIELEPSYMAAISLAKPPEDLIARPDDLTFSANATRFEIGNFNLPAAYALGAAVDLITKISVSAIESHCYALGDYLIRGLDDIGVPLVGPRQRENRSPHIYVARLPASHWYDYLSQNNIRISPERDGIRISLGMFNIEHDIDKLLHTISHGLKEHPLRQTK